MSEIVTDKQLTLQGANDQIITKLHNPDDDYFYKNTYEIFATGRSPGILILSHGVSRPIPSRYCPKQERRRKTPGGLA